MNIDYTPPAFPYSWATDWGEDQYGLWMGLSHNGVRCVFRWVDSGTFMMGSPESEEGRYDYEDQHQVTFRQGLWVAETTVTQALWESVMEVNPSHFKGENRPVEEVSWDDCQVFIEKLNTVHFELEVRLPWEAEWEYACRAGTETAYNFGQDLTLEKVNYREVRSLGLENDSEERGGLSQWVKEAKQETTDVRSYPCNHWGLYEMHGNILEWCQDYWQENLGTKSVTNPQCVITEAEDGTERAIRGGSWLNSGGSVRSAYRGHLSPGIRSSRIGFRLFLVNLSDSSFRKQN